MAVEHMQAQQKKQNLKLALILGSVAVVFFLGFLLKMIWLGST
jgi:flagellar basal body-associated protein FliL